MNIDCAFPGGNIVIERIDGDRAFVRQDIRDTAEWWFWWAFRVSGAAGRTVTFHFTNGDVFAAPGACMSVDRIHWRWIPRIAHNQTTLTVEAPCDAPEIYLAFSPLYTQIELDRFLGSLADRDPSGGLIRERLCVTEKGREVELLRRPARSGAAPAAALIARTHACEMTANFVLEGIMTEWLLSDSEPAQWLRANRELVIAPFVDRDGVEDGDQGKSRSPHDHNRDFGADSRYASVRALKERLPQLGGRVEFFLDLHSPWARNDRNDTIFFVGCEEPWQTEAERLKAYIAHDALSPYPLWPDDMIPLGVDWNTPRSDTAGAWVRRTLAPRFATTLEIAFGQVHGIPTSIDGYRRFGAAACRAIGKLLSENE